MMLRLHLPDALKQTILFGASIAFMKGISLLMLPFIASHLSTEEYGRLEVITTLAIIGSILVGMGLENALFRFVGVIENAEQRKRMAAEIFSLTLIMGSIALLACLFAAGLIASWMPGKPTEYEVRLVLLMLSLEGCIAIPLGWLRMSNRAYSFCFTTTGRALLHAILIIVQLTLNKGVEGILEAGLIAAVIQMTILCFLHIRDTGFHFEQRTTVRCFIYSLPIVGSGIAAFALNGLERWILADQTSLDDVAQFGIAAKFALALVLLMQPFNMWWLPRRFEVLSQADGRTRAAYFISLGLSAVLIITLMVGLAAPLLINWLLPDSYNMAGQYVLGLVIVMALREITTLINIGCFSGKTTFTQLIINITASVAGILLMLWWSPLHGVWGIIFALISAQLLRLILFYKTSQHYIYLSYPTNSITILTVICASLMLLGTQTTILSYQFFIAISLAPLAILLALRLPFLMILMFVIFSFFRIHEVFPQLFSLRIPLLFSLASLGSLAWHVGITRKIEVYWRPELTAITVFFVLVIIGIIFASNRPVAMMYFNGIYWKIIVMTFSIAWLTRNEKDFSMASRLITIAGVMVGSVALYNKMNGIGLVEGTRVTIGRDIQSVLGDPNDLALVLMFPIAFAVSLTMTRGLGRTEKILGIVSTIVLFSAVIATQSRGGLLGILAVFGVFGYRRIKSKVLFFGIGIVAAAILFVLAGISDRASGGSAESGIDASAMGRLHAWEAAYGMALHNPLTGVGINNFYYNYFFYSPSWDGRNHAVHSTWFGVLAETGFVGLIVFAFTIGLLIRSAYSSLTRIEQQVHINPVIHSTAQAVLAGLLGTAVSGTFLTQAFTWPIYILAALIVSVAHWVETHLQTDSKDNKARQFVADR